MPKQRDQLNRTDQFDRDRAVILRSGGVDSEVDKIKPITIDCGGRHIGKFVAAAMRAVRRKEAEVSSIHLVCASLRQMSSKDRYSEGAAVV